MPWNQLPEEVKDFDRLIGVARAAQEFDVGRVVGLVLVHDGRKMASLFDAGKRLAEVKPQG